MNLDEMHKVLILMGMSVFVISELAKKIIPKIRGLVKKFCMLDLVAVATFSVYAAIPAVYYNYLLLEEVVKTTTILG